MRIPIFLTRGKKIVNYLLFHCCRIVKLISLTISQYVIFLFVGLMSVLYSHCLQSDRWVGDGWGVQAFILIIAFSPTSTSTFTL